MSTKKKKEYNVKPTLRQRKFASNLVENGGNKYKAAIDAGYDEAVATNPQKVTESRGFQQIANEVGLTDEFILQALTDDIRAKKRKREPELRLASKIKGLSSERVDITSKGEPLAVPESLYKRYKKEE